jgi:hypothetical protein
VGEHGQRIQTRVDVGEQRRQHEIRGGKARGAARCACTAERDRRRWRMNSRPKPHGGSRTESASLTSQWSWSIARQRSGDRAGSNARSASNAFRPRGEVLRSPSTIWPRASGRTTGPVRGCAPARPEADRSSPPIDRTTRNRPYGSTGTPVSPKRYSSRNTSCIRSLKSSYPRTHPRSPAATRDLA